jgi:hypothetical protein
MDTQNLSGERVYPLVGGERIRSLDEGGGFFTESLGRPVADSGDEEARENAAGELFDHFDDLPRGSAPRRRVPL